MQVSEEAKAALASFLEGRGKKEILRLGVANGHHTLAVDEARAGDITFQHGGRPVLVVAPGLAQGLWGLVIDVEPGEASLRIVLRRIAKVERGDTGADSFSASAVDRRSDEHRRLLEDVNAITAEIAALRLSRSADKVLRIRELEATKQARWHEIRVLFVATRPTHWNLGMSRRSLLWGPNGLVAKKELSMLAITDDAKELLRDVLQQRGEPSQALRLSETAEGLEVALDQAGEDDVIYDVDGRDVLIVQRDLANRMDGTTIQREESPDGPRLVISK